MSQILRLYLQIWSNHDELFAKEFFWVVQKICQEIVCICKTDCILEGLYLRDKAHGFSPAGKNEFMFWI